MSALPPTLYVLSDQLEIPPSLGYQIHVLGLVGALRPLVRTRAFCWMREPPPHEGLVPMDAAAAPHDKWIRKLHYVQRAFARIDAEAAPGSVAWVRNYSTAVLALPGLRQRRRAGLRCLYDASSFLRLEVPLAPKRWSASLRSLAEELVRPGFDRVRTLNGPMRDYLVRKGIPAERIMVIPVGADPPAEPWRPHPSPRRLLYVGSAMPWQGLPTLLAAMRILEGRAPEIELTLAGPTPAIYDGRPIPPNVHPLGSVPHAGIGRLLVEHDLFVLPRPRLPVTEIVTPMKLLEAMACGMPILASDLAAIRWATGPDGAVLLGETEDPEALAAAIERTLGDPPALAAAGRRAFERSLGFRWDALAPAIVRELFAGDRA